MTDRYRRGRTRGSSPRFQPSRRHSYQDSTDSYQYRRSAAFNSVTKSPRPRYRNNRRVSKTPGSRVTEFQQFTRPSSRVVRSVYEGMRASAVRLEDALVTLNANLERLAPDPGDMPYSPTMGTVVYVPVPHPSPAASVRVNSALTSPTVVAQKPNIKVGKAGTSINPVAIAPRPPCSHITVVHPGNHEFDNFGKAVMTTQIPTQPAIPAREASFFKDDSLCGTISQTVNIPPSTRGKIDVKSLSLLNPLQNHQDVAPISGWQQQYTNTNTIPDSSFSNYRASPQPPPARWITSLITNNKYLNKDGTLANILTHQPMPQQESKSVGESGMQRVQNENLMLGQRMKQGEHLM